ncbi:hypothetical protein K435DRAFT_849478 [Dendrothele bispora CBS 962.96]|uniref:DNA replication regulator SLD2 n=1 Tax=Dendrothele bispora (strain CBS 962.96) TaxID=1314807 RepID=A0A4S8MUF5_DENBC|nr:hypothetical protein K435DRAFT_849478 [Dendrothele bispora CBS 962.96]
MSHDVPALRAEIKAWERKFKDTHGRDPSVQDIRDNPDIAAKYKLYKKVSKAPSKPSAPSTPKRTQASSSSLPRPRPVEITAPLSTFNPFSPVKNKGKQKEVSPIKKTFPNPFATPSKSKPVPRVRQVSPSPPPSPSPASKEPRLASTSALVEQPPIDAPPTAVSRARKRLRGDPVSPSPNKEKRRRVQSQTILPFPRRSADLSSSDEEGGDDPGNSSFVDDSPVKASAGAKSFQTLFEDATGLKSTLSHSKTAPSGSGLFGSFSRTEVEDDLDNVLGNSNRPKLVNGKPISNELTDKTRNLASLRSSTKRGLSDLDAESGADQQTKDTDLVLIPPSPPPESSSYRPPNDNKRGKNPRKKAKLGEDDSSDTDVLSDDELKVVVGPPKRQLHAEHAQDEGLGSEPILRYLLPADSTHQNQSQDESEDQESFDVQLPDKLRDILALSSSSESKTYNIPEDQVVESLLYGRRMTHYDPSRGGEIWDVGDSEHVGADIEDEEDWEGEPVPWETGEL